MSRGLNGMEQGADFGENFSLKVYSDLTADALANECGYRLPSGGFWGELFHVTEIVGRIAWMIVSGIVEVRQLVSYRSQHPVQIPPVGPIMLLHLQRHLKATMYGPFKLGIPRSGQCRRNLVALNCYKVAGFQIITDKGRRVKDADFDMILENYKLKSRRQQTRIDNRMRFDVQYKEF